MKILNNMKKFSKIIESKKYYEELGYNSSVMDYLSKAYQLWTDAEGLPQLSADEHDSNKLTPEQQKFIYTFIDMWNIVTDFEKEYDDPNFIAKLKSKKYNL